MVPDFLHRIQIFRCIRTFIWKFHVHWLYIGSMPRKYIGSLDDYDIIMMI